LIRERADVGDAVFLQVLARTCLIDACLRQALDNGARQVVILGAGYDSRAYRTQHPAQPRFFEVDFPPTQEYKKIRVREIFGWPPDGVVYVPIDFQKDNLVATLQNAGYQRNQRTFFIWEGVTYYLREAEVDSTLRFVAAESAPGSSIVFDYALDRVIRGEHDD
jgi:methyltransferase (TIGR00027 family)